MAQNDKQLHTMRHMLGINTPYDAEPEPYRNYAAVAPGGDRDRAEELAREVCVEHIRQCYRSRVESFRRNLQKERQKRDENIREVMGEDVSNADDPCDVGKDFWRVVTAPPDREECEGHAICTRTFDDGVTMFQVLGLNDGGVYRFDSDEWSIEPTCTLMMTEAELEDAKNFGILDEEDCPEPFMLDS